MTAETSPKLQAGKSALDRLLTTEPLRATSFIVTVYGDAVEPRGGVLWIGTLIEVCSEFGVSETLIRTAVSRLVAAGRLVGEREGRRSYYRLTSAARTEFAAAARILFDPAEPKGWLLLRPANAEAIPAGQAGWAELGSGMYVGPDREDLPHPAGLLLRARTIGGAEDLPAFAASLWALNEHVEAYQAFLESFEPLDAELASDGPIDGRSALLARLLLVHRFRSVVLRDPRLPREALSAGWPGEGARRLFDRLYLRISPWADQRIGQSFRSESGHLPVETAVTRRRLETLAQSAG